MILKLPPAQPGMHRKCWKHIIILQEQNRKKKCTILTMSQESPTDTNPDQPWSVKGVLRNWHNSNVPALKLRFLSNRKLKTSINHVSLNIKKLSTNTNKYLNVQCACNEDSYFPCLCPSLLSSSPQQQDDGEGKARGILDLLHPSAVLFSLSLR